MKIRIAENIRSFRKAAGLTQEQLAEAVGVTVGAVSKWEASLSNPDLAMIVKLADLFEISVDVLLGYDWKSMSMGQAAARIKELCLAKKYGEGRETAEKALLKYPNCFEVVYQSALLFHIAGADHSIRRTKFYRGPEKYSYDGFGESAMQGIEACIREDKAPGKALLEIWRKIADEKAK